MGLKGKYRAPGNGDGFISLRGIGNCNGGEILTWRRRERGGWRGVKMRTREEKISRCLKMDKKEILLW